MRAEKSLPRLDLLGIFYEDINLLLSIHSKQDIADSNVLSGQWVASPSLGSAGPTIKKVAFGIGLVGLIVSACLYVHMTAKYVFVRALRNTVHLQKPTLIHWAVWLGSAFTIGVLAFILAEAIPIFNYLIALNGSFCFAPLAIVLPTILWFYDHWHYKSGTLVEKMKFYGHVLIFLVGVFMTIGGTYGVIVLIKQAYADGTIGKPTMSMMEFDTEWS